MTVQQLIDELNKIENKSQQTTIFSDCHPFGEVTLKQIHSHKGEYFDYETNKWFDGEHLYFGFEI